MYKYKATILDVYDGDTITVNVDLGFGIFTTQKLRLTDDDEYFDTPEVRRGSKVNEAHKAHGLAAKARAIELMPIGSTIIIDTEKKGKYGRYLADVTLMSGEVYSNIMISEGFQKKTNY